jgi:hypothetical protein
MLSIEKDADQESWPQKGLSKRSFFTISPFLGRDSPIHHHCPFRVQSASSLSIQRHDSTASLPVFVDRAPIPFFQTTQSPSFNY